MIQNLNAKAVKPVYTSTIGFYRYKQFKTGGCVEIIQGYIRRSDHKDLFTVARAFAMKGKKVQITTDIHHKDEKYKQIFGKLIGTIYERKCPDLIIDEEFYEYESFIPPFKKRKIANMISHGLQQSAKLIINNNKGCSDRFILRAIRNRLIDKCFKGNIEEIWLYEKGNVRKILW